MQGSGGSPPTTCLTHRTIRTALNQALRRGDLNRNVATLAVAPRVTDRKVVDPYPVDEVQRLLIESGKRRNSACRAIALALALR
jgi:hypothetical protein